MLPIDISKIYAWCFSPSRKTGTDSSPYLSVRRQHRQSSVRNPSWRKRSSLVRTSHRTLCHQGLPDSFDRAAVVILHTLAYAPVSADVHRGVICGEFREDLHDDFEVQRQRSWSNSPSTEHISWSTLRLTKPDAPDFSRRATWPSCAAISRTSSRSGSCMRPANALF